LGGLRLCQKIEYLKTLADYAGFNIKVSTYQILPSSLFLKFHFFS